MIRQRWAGLFLALLCWALLVPIAAAQSGVLVNDEAGQLNASRIKTAASPLVSSGAQVVVMTVDGGAESDFDAYLRREGIAQGAADSQLPANFIGVFIGYNPNLSFIYYGRNYSAALSGQAESIRSNQLNGGLRSGDATQGVVDTLSAISRTIGDPVGTRTETSSEGGGSGVIIVIAAIAVGVLALFVVPAMLKRRSEGKQQASTLAQTQGRYEQSRRGAGGAIADLGQQMRDAEEKLRFDPVSYPATQVQELARRHRAVSTKFIELQQQFDAIEERMEATQQARGVDFESAAGVYDGIREQASGLTNELTSMDVLRKELDAISAKAPAEVERVKKF